MDRSTCLERWRMINASGRPTIGAGAGAGISAKCAEAGEADLIIIYNSGRYRMAGRGSLAGMMPYGGQGITSRLTRVKRATTRSLSGKYANPTWFKPDANAF